MSDDLLTLRELAEKAGMNYEQARKRLQRKAIQPAKIIGRNNFYSADVVELIKDPFKIKS